MEADLTMATNNWIIEDPAWANYSHCICTKEHYWTSYCGTDFFLRTKRSPGGRIWFTWPDIAEHFYALQWCAGRWDTIFASYSLMEIQRFIDTLSWSLDSKRHRLRVRDEVTNEYIPITKFIQD